MAQSTAAPLSLALLGEWGSGKSSVMRQMRNEIALLASSSGANVGESDFLATVLQVSFNAWHFSDDLVWPGLVDHLFGELSTAVSDEGLAPHTEVEARRQRQRLQAELEETQATRRRREDALKRAREARRGLLGPVAALAVLVKAWAYDAGDELRRSWRWLLLLFVVGIVSVFLWSYLDSRLALLPLLVPGGGTAIKLWRKRGSVRAFVNAPTELLERRQNDAERLAEDLKSQLALVSARERLRHFLEEERHSTDAYAPYRGPRPFHSRVGRAVTCGFAVGLA